mmetsp:Transcript_99054/g.275784  ORF Transcript_99054/g.275784 Transcript_99054/m.275784 type:complete len:132 (+) Transcript_99054:78-473(+)
MDECAGRRLSLIASTGDVAALKAEMEKLQETCGPELAAQESVTCEFGERNSHSALHVAAMRGHWEILELLLQARADANATDDTANTPLHFAAELGHARAASVLLRHGADKGARNNFGRSPEAKVVVNSWDS